MFKLATSLLLMATVMAESGTNQHLRKLSTCNSSVGSCYIRNLDTQEEQEITDDFVYYPDGGRYSMRCDVSGDADHSKWHFNDGEVSDDWRAPFWMKNNADDGSGRVWDADYLAECGEKTVLVESYLWGKDAPCSSRTISFTAGCGPEPVTVRGIIRNTNLAPFGGNCHVLWLGIHDGSFDLYNFGEKVEESDPIFTFVEDSRTVVLDALFASNETGLLWSANAGGNQCPGSTRTVPFEFSFTVGKSYYLSFAQKIMPSNDAFAANDDPKTFEIIDRYGNFKNLDHTVLGNMILDAGTEVNEEFPTNTTFFFGAVDGAGLDEDNVVRPHPGFLPIGGGGIRDFEEFGTREFENADFTADGYIGFNFCMTVEGQESFCETIPPRSPANVRGTITVTNVSPTAYGTCAEPVWVGVHDGSFDTTNGRGDPVSEVLEVLGEEFDQSRGGVWDGVIGSSYICPGETFEIPFAFSVEDQVRHFLSYATVVSNTLVTNDDSEARRLFSERGLFNALDFTVAADGSDILHFCVALEGDDRCDPSTPPAPAPIQVAVKTINASPDNGLIMTQAFVGFHTGEADIFDIGQPASEGMELVAENGFRDATVLIGEFESMLGGVFGRRASRPALGPQTTRENRFQFTPSAGKAHYVTYATGIRPSNDAFVGNDDPKQYQVIAADGTLLPEVSIVITGDMVLDAGTEVNDEIPENTANFGQTVAGTGVVENGVIGPHPGFLPVGSGGILDDPIRADADFTQEGFVIGRIEVTVA